MASSKEAGCGYDAVVKVIGEYVTATGGKDKTQFNSKALGRLVTEKLECSSNLKKLGVKNAFDASVFPAIKEKGKPHMVVNKSNVKQLVRRGALEMAKNESKNPKIDPKDETVKKFKRQIKKNIATGDVKHNATKVSGDAATARLTDTSKYTGAHKERFDKDGKGKGADGRVDKADTSGYVGGYKNKDTYDKKK